VQVSVWQLRFKKKSVPVIFEPPCTTIQEVHNITTRSNTNLHPPVCNLTVLQKGTYYSGIKLFNHLPLKIKGLSNKIKLFKPALKWFLDLHSFYSVEEYLECSFNEESCFLYGAQWKCICSSSLIILNCVVYSNVVYWKYILIQTTV